MIVNLFERAKHILRNIVFFIYLPLAIIYLAIIPNIFNYSVDEYWVKVRNIVRRIFVILGIRIEMNEVSHEKFMASSGAIIVANHTSHMDALALISILPEGRSLAFVAKKSLSKIPVLSMVLKSSGTIFIERGAGDAAFKAISENPDTLIEGQSLFVFPEGTRSLNIQGVTKFKTGAVRLGLALERDIVPICIKGAEDILSRNDVFPKSGVITLNILDRISPSQSVSAKSSTEKLEAQMNSFIKAS